jgi:hypothetical protein
MLAMFECQRKVALAASSQQRNFVCSTTLITNEKPVTNEGNIDRGKGQYKLMTSMAIQLHYFCTFDCERARSR